MTNEGYLCPICESDMVERQGPKIKFYGCSMYPKCLGKRTMDGTVFGVDDETPLGLNDEGEDMFRIGLSEGRSYDEAKEMAFDWQRWQDKD